MVKKTEQFHFFYFSVLWFASQRARSPIGLNNNNSSTWMLDPEYVRHLTPSVELILHKQGQASKHTSKNINAKWRRPTLFPLNPGIELQVQPKTTKSKATLVSKRVHREVQVPALETWSAIPEPQYPLTSYAHVSKLKRSIQTRPSPETVLEHKRGSKKATLTVFRN